MLLRFVLALILLVVAGAIGYLVGRGHATGGPPPAEVPRPQTGERSRTEAEQIAMAAPAVPDPPHVEPAPQEPITPPETTPAAVPADSAPLLRRSLVLPIANLQPSDIHDTFEHSRAAGSRIHEAADIMAPRGTPVRAMDNGIIQKLFNSVPGGLTIYQFDSAQEYCFYYAHLDGYAPGLKEGMLVRKGDLIGYVGSTGNADDAAPHLHLAIFKLGPEKRWWEGNRPINPYPVLMAQFKWRE